MKGVDSIEIDNMGNIVALKGKDSSRSVMIGAHMDEIGFIVTHINDEVFEVSSTWWFWSKTLTAQVIVHGKKDLIGVMGSKPVHIMTSEEKIGSKINDYYIDLA